MVEVCLPGTGGMIPLPNRWLACCWIELGGRAVLIDCGEGTQIALKKSGCQLNLLETLLITHFHTDHVAGLPGLLLALGNSGKTSALTVAGPAGLAKILSAVLLFMPQLPYEVKIREISVCGTWTAESGDFEISCMMLSHGITCLGYGIAVKIPASGAHKALFNIPAELFKIFRTGISHLGAVGAGGAKTVPDGRSEFIRVCYCTDTLPVDAIADFVRGADLFICEGMYGDEKEHERVAKKGHMLFSESAELAKKAGVRRLWLTHYGPGLLHPDRYLNSVRRIFPNITAAHDGTRVTLGR